MNTATLPASHRHRARVWALATLLTFSMFGTLLATQARAEVPAPPIADTSTLPTVPASPEGWMEPNPLRGQPEAQRIGRDAFNQVCARCHGIDANGSRAPAPDLRRVGQACQRVSDPAWKARCLADADAWYSRSVRQGKKKFGIEHMPAWEGVLTPQLGWAIRSFIETAPK
jgi:mono/diheme cytochrome c family protein